MAGEPSRWKNSSLSSSTESCPRGLCWGSHLACCQAGCLTFRPGQEGKEPKSAGRWLGQPLQRLITPLPCLLKLPGERGRFPRVTSGSGAETGIFIHLVHCIAGSSIFTKKSCHLCQLCFGLWFPNSAERQNYCGVGAG